MLRDAYPFLLVLVFLAVIVAFVGYFFAAGFYVLSVLMFLLAAFVAFFFRNPERDVSSDPDLVLSPADGHVSIVKPIDAQQPDGGMFVSIFLSVFDVHVNRTPIAGRITKIAYQKGKFLNALNHRSSLENEQNIVTVENDRLTVTFKQIAGVIARRIVFWQKIGDTLAPGERVGLIKFGSRTDLFLPPQVEVLVKKGDRVIGGETIIGKIRQ
ncbi:MAG: phosphatidylserine decarboxylase family protein [Blastocatellia bacterium]